MKFVASLVFAAVAAGQYSPYQQYGAPQGYQQYAPQNYGGAYQPGYNNNSPQQIALPASWGSSEALTAANFEATVVDDTSNVWIVAFINPDCGYCKKLEPQW